LHLKDTAVALGPDPKLLSATSLNVPEVANDWPASWSIELRNPERLPSSLVGRVEDRHPDEQQNEGCGRRIKLARDIAEHFDLAVCSKELIYMYRYESDTFSEGEYLAGRSDPLFLGDLEHLGPRLNGTATI
jgi:hypothetical protein